jgi:hypothetical protein
MKKEKITYSELRFFTGMDMISDTSGHLYKLIEYLQLAVRPGMVWLETEHPWRLVPLTLTTHSSSLNFQT